MLFLLILVFFFFSGMTGLIYQVIWTRMVVKVIGAPLFAISMILTVFMGGLGIGSYLASRHIDKIQDTVKLIMIFWRQVKTSNIVMIKFFVRFFMVMLRSKGLKNIVKAI